MDLACSYHDEVVGPLLAARWPGLPYAAARLGSGSDVLGLDDAMSRDHDWGLRLTVLLDRTAAAAVGGIGAVDSHLERVLPASFRSLPTRFATTWDPTVRQRAEVATPEEFAASRLGIGVDRPWNAEDWLAVTGQSVLEITGGPVFRDTPGTITDIRRRLACTRTTSGGTSSRRTGPALARNFRSSAGQAHGVTTSVLGCSPGGSSP